MRGSLGRFIFTICLGASALGVLPSCGRTSAPVVPSLSVPGVIGAALPQKAGNVKLFADTFGDPTPQGITLGPDGAIWFTDGGNDLVGRMTARGQYTLQIGPGDEVDDGITSGPDGALWFTTASHIGRVTIAGLVTLFPDTGGSFPQSITTGPDGALWYAESNGRVGRITTSGRVKHFRVAPNNAMLEGIVTGPDGNLWVTQYVVGGSRFSNQVLRVSTAGKSKSFTVGSGPEFICVGPDGALWFTEADANALGRLTTKGSYHEFSTGRKYGQPSGIATGPDHALWFTFFSDNAEIGHMTTSGDFQFYPVTGSAPELDQIAAGLNHVMWFTSTFGPPAIGRIRTR